MTGRIPGAMLAVLLIAGAAMADETGETMGVGEIRDFQLDGKPSTGYRWVLDEEGSTGLDAVTVESLGYGETYTRLLGSSAPFGFRVTCETNGNAELLFDYLAPDGSTVSDTRTLPVRCE